MRKWFGMLLMSMLLMAGCMQVSAAETGVLALGANLSDSQKAEVYAQMGITAEQAASYQTIYITNDMEHQYLDASLGASVVGTHSLSSVLLIPQESGAGLNVETHDLHVSECVADCRCGRCQGDRGSAKSHEWYGCACWCGKSV